MLTIVYARRTLHKIMRKCKYGITELENLGTLWDVKHIWLYLHYHHFDIYTDHEALGPSSCMTFLPIENMKDCG